MLLVSLLNQPALFVAWVVAIVIVITIHEFSHALAATWLGDPTAEREGRLTLNPWSHLSGFGFLALMLIGFGWGKPVPFNPYNLKYKRFGPALVALAGPLSNLFLALLFFLLMRYFESYTSLTADNLAVVFTYLAIRLNLGLMIFNLIPIPPLDGSKILFAFLSSPRFDGVVNFLEENGPSLFFFIIIIDSVMGMNIFGSFLQWTLGAFEKLLFGA